MCSVSLKLYSDEALLQVAQIQRLDVPSQNDKNNFAELRNSLKDCAKFPEIFLHGEEGNAWEPNTSYDLISVNPLPKRDTLELCVSSMLQKVHITSQKFICNRNTNSVTQHMKPEHDSDGDPHHVDHDDYDPHHVDHDDWDLEQNEKDKKLQRNIVEIGQLVVMVASAALPGVAVLGLYLIKNTQKRLYVLIGLTVAFSMVTRFLTAASKIEIFAATAT